LSFFPFFFLILGVGDSMRLVGSIAQGVDRYSLFFLKKEKSLELF
jgi:hypothetical protein